MVQQCFTVFPGLRRWFGASAGQPLKGLAADCGESNRTTGTGRPANWSYAAVKTEESPGSSFSWGHNPPGDADECPSPFVLPIANCELRKRPLAADLFAEAANGAPPLLNKSRNRGIVGA